MQARARVQTAQSRPSAGGSAFMEQIGLAIVHSEYLLLSDVHIASERAVYGDLPHPTFGIAAGDGLHVVWEEVAGTARAKWLLWTGE